MKPKQWVKSPKGYVTMMLVLFLIVASLAAHSWEGAGNAIWAVVVALIVDVACSRIERRKRIFPDGAVITGLIVALILSMTTPWYIVAATSAISILSKHLLTYKKKPLFNPAAFGLLLSVPLFHSQQNWWGAFGDLSAWFVPVLLLGGYWVTGRIQKFPQVFAFLGTYLIVLFALGLGLLHGDTESFQAGGFYDALRTPFINATLFFALLMLTDPPTSPAKTTDQIVFGVVAAVIGAGIYGRFGGLIYLYIGLLTGNLYHFLRARFSQRMAKPVRTEIKKAGA